MPKPPAMTKGAVEQTNLSPSLPQSTALSQSSKFNLLNYIGSDGLRVLKEENTQLVCECPVCGGHRLTIDKKTGKYQCWSGGCECKEIREAIAPWGDQSQRQNNRIIHQKAKPKVSTPAPLPEEINLARLPQPATDSPQPQKRFDKQHGEVLETTYYYTPDRGKTRVEWADTTKVKGHDKKFVLWYRDANGVAIAKAGENVRPLYRINELLAAAKASGANAGLCGEGEGVVEAHRCRLGLCCTTLSGFSRDELALMAQMFKDAGLTLVFHPDNDETGRKKALKVQEACDRVGVPCIVIVPTNICPGLPESGDICDILATMQEPEFLQRLQIEIRRALLERQIQQNSLDKETTNKQDGGGGGSDDDVLNEVLSRFGGRFRLNKLTGQVELDAEPIRVDEFYITLRRKLGMKVGKQLIIDLVMQLARENEYSPVVEYLEDVYQQHSDSTVSLLDDMASRYFGTTEPLFNVYVRRTLIGAVARALNPGCKADTALILQGTQGLGKSSFFSTLAGPWFDDSLGSTSDKDERLKLRAHWILEWAELERAFSRRSTGDVKSFLSCSVDNLRVPYGRTVEAFPRHCVFVGSTNEQEFLADSTGDRRFWVIPVQQRIDCKLLAIERDRIWAAAVALYRKSERWWFEPHEQALSQSLNQSFHVEDPWMQYIREHVDALPDSGGMTRVYIRDILANCLQIDKGKQDKASQMRVAAILRRLGFTKKPDSRGTPCWSKVLTPPLTPLLPTVTSKNEVSVPSNQDIASSSANVLSPTDTFLTTFSKDVDAILDRTEKASVSDLSKDVAVVSVGVSNDAVSMVSIADTPTSTSTDTPERSQEIAQSQHLEPSLAVEVTVAIADYVVDKLGSVTRIVELARGGWITSAGDHVSRDDLKAGNYTKVAPTHSDSLDAVEQPPDEWSSAENIETLAGWLADCESLEMLVEIRSLCPYPSILKTACKKLDADRFKQIKQWVLELNEKSEAFGVSEELTT